MRLLFLFAALAVFAARPKGTADVPVVVFVDGHGTLPGSAWWDAKARVGSIFSEVHVNVVLRDGTPPVQPARDSITALLHLAAIRWTGSPVEAPICSDRSAFGCSFGLETARPTVIVMYERIRFYHRRPRLFASLLAHVMAHEITHVLTGNGEHSDSGLMKQRWTAADFDQMETSRLEFTPAVIAAIQQGLEKRRSGRLESNRPPDG